MALTSVSRQAWSFNNYCKGQDNQVRQKWPFFCQVMLREMYPTIAQTFIHVSSPNSQVKYYLVLAVGQTITGGCVLWATVLLFVRKVHGVFSSCPTAADESIQVGDHRQFLSRSTCKLNIVPGKRYLLMGRDGETVDCNKK